MDFRKYLSENIVYLDGGMGTLLQARGLTPGELPEDVDDRFDPMTGLVPLGDMAISLDHAKAQAKEFGHSVNREVGYLTVHSVLHLLGYDHLDEGPMKQQMRAREEMILAKLGLTRG